MRYITYIACLLILLGLYGCSKANNVSSNEPYLIKNTTPLPDPTKYGPNTYKQGIPIQKSTQHTTDHIYAYLTFRSRIYSYELSGGIFTPVKNGVVNVGSVVNRVIVDKNAKYAYITDTKGYITRFKIDSNGALVDPWSFHMKAGGSTKECVIDNSGKHIYVAINGYYENKETGGKVAQLSILDDGTLKPMEPYTVDVSNSTGRIYMHPSGKYLYAGSYGGAIGIRGLVVGSDGISTVMPIDATKNISTLCTEMAMTNDGENLFVGDNKEYQFKWASVDKDGSLSLVSEVYNPRGIDIGGVMSVEVDSYGNALMVTPSRWLSTYKMENNTLQPNVDFACLHNGNLMPRSDMVSYFETTDVYKQAFDKSKDQYLEEKKNRAIRSSMHAYCSLFFGVRSAPDGFVYAFSTSGVYRFQSTPEGIVYSGPAITWNDSITVVIRESMDPDLSGSVIPVFGGITFAQR